MITEVSRVSNNGDRISKLIDIQNQNLQDGTKSRVKQMLVQDVELLLQKKRKQQQKRERVKKMQQQLEVKRSNKLKVIEQKADKSQMVRARTRKQNAEKFKKNTQFYQNKLKKIAADHQNDIQRKLSQRRSYLQNSRTTKVFSKTSKDHLSKSKTQLLYSQNAEQQVIQKLRNINDKFDKASMKHEQHQKDIIEKIRQKSKHINQAQRRAMNLSIITQTEKLKNQYKKNQQMEKIYIRTKSLNEKKLNERRRTFKDKLDKCSQNLRQISYMEEQKFHELQNKFEKQAQPKQWKDPRMQKYFSLFQSNARRLQIKKAQKAQEILHKHQQITQQNKIYKQRKNKLIEAIKHS